MDANIAAIILCENNFNDSSGNGYNLTSTGTPGFSTAQKYEGNYSKYDNRTGGAVSPAELNTILAGASEFTIEWYVYATDHGGAQDDMLYVNGTYYAWSVLYTASSGCGANSLVLFTRTGYSCCGDYTAYYNTWVRHNLEWNGTNWKYYLNGNLVATRSESTNPFATSNFSLTPGNRSVQYFDRIIISTALRNGAETNITSSPTITDISPLTGSTAGGTAVTITGTGFATGATVTFDGTSATSIVVVSATEITCVTPAHTAGAVDVVVTNTDTGTVTSAGGFTYVSSGSKSIGTFGFPKSRFKRQRLGAI